MNQETKDDLIMLVGCYLIIMGLDELFAPDGRITIYHVPIGLAILLVFMHIRHQKNYD